MNESFSGIKSQNELDSVKLTVIKQRKCFHKELMSIKKLYKKNFSGFKHLKKINTACKMVINLLNAVTVSSIVVTYTDSLSILYISLAASTTASLMGVLLDSYNISDKISRYHTTYLQLVDLFNTYRSKYLKCKKNPTHLDEILGELNTKIGLILDSAELVSISSG